MDSSSFLARAYGLYFIIMGFLLFFRSAPSIQIIRDLYQNRVLVFAVGWITLILGILVVVGQNVWELSWKLTITVLGYLTLLKGIAHLYVPDVMEKMNFSKNINRHRYIYGAFCLLGGLLFYMSFL